MLALHEGHFEQSVGYLLEEIALATERKDAFREMAARRSLARWYVDQSRYGEALNECDRALQIASELKMPESQRETLQYRGLAYLGLGQAGEAMKIEDKLDRMLAAGPNNTARRHYWRLAGMIDLYEGKTAEAIQSFKEAIALLGPPAWDKRSHAWYYDPLASAYYRSGDLERAQEEYEKITRLGPGRLNHGDIYVKAFYWLGRIAEKRGDPVRAHEHYRKFLDLWNDADPGIPEIEDASRRLVRMKPDG